MNAHFDLDFEDPSYGGIFFVTSDDLEPLGEAAGMQGLRVCRIDLAGYADRDWLFDRLAAALRLPADFGRNWDALADSVRDLSWLKADAPDHTEARTDQYVAAFRYPEDTNAHSFTTAYMVRAVSPGTFVLPGATVEDMYRPELRANTAAGTLEVVAPKP